MISPSDTPQFKENPDGSVVLFMRMTPSWIFLDDVRRFIEVFCKRACPEGFSREQDLALAAHELLQNAISYSRDGQAEMSVQLEPKSETVAITVVNTARPEEVTRLEALVAEMKQVNDPFRYFLTVMDRPSETLTRGGLGLARICYEAALDVDVKLNGEHVTITAEGPLHRRGESLPSPS
jgi:hypothetical protein